MRIDRGEGRFRDGIPLEKPEEQIEEMTEEQHAGEVNGAGVLDKLINGVSIWP